MVFLISLIVERSSGSRSCDARENEDPLQTCNPQLLRPAGQGANLGLVIVTGGSRGGKTKTGIRNIIGNKF